MPRVAVPKAMGALHPLLPRHRGAGPRSSPHRHASHLELNAIACVDGDVVGALQVAVQGQRGVVRGVDVALRVMEAHAAEDWGERVSGIARG